MKGNFSEALAELIPLLSAADTNLDLELTSTTSTLKSELVVLTDASYSLPSLDITSQISNVRNGNSSQQLHESFSQKLSAPLHCNSESLLGTPKQLLDNISASFGYLLDSRITNSKAAIMSHPTLTDSLKDSILKALSSSGNRGPWTITSKLTRFEDVGPDNPETAATTTTTDQPDELDRRINFECIMDMLLLQQLNMTVKFGTVGYCKGTVNLESGLMQTVVFSLDTMSLLHELISEARKVCSLIMVLATNSVRNAPDNSTPSDPNDNSISFSSQLHRNSNSNQSIDEKASSPKKPSMIHKNNTTANTDTNAQETKHVSWDMHVKSREQNPNETNT